MFYSSAKPVGFLRPFPLTGFESNLDIYNMEDSQTFHCTLSLYYQNVLRELQKSQTTLHLGVYSVKPPKEFFNVKKS